jgi:hypothetical protein
MTPDACFTIPSTAKPDKPAQAVARCVQDHGRCWFVILFVKGTNFMRKQATWLRTLALFVLLFVFVPLIATVGLIQYTAAPTEAAGAATSPPAPTTPTAGAATSTSTFVPLVTTVDPGERLTPTTVVAPTTETTRVNPPGWRRISSATGDIPNPEMSNEQTAALVLDIDKDGRNDFVIGARRRGPALVAFRRTDAGWDRLVIEQNTLPIEAGGAVADIDRDGDLDLVFGEDFQGAKVYWWENPAPQFDPNTRWKRYEIKNSGAKRHHDQTFGDFDGDGQQELAFWNQQARALFLADIPADPKNTQPWPTQQVFVGGANGKYEGLAAADIDSDGVIDLVGGGRWFKHQSGGRYTAEVIDEAQSYTRTAAAQLIAGGRAEVVFVAGDEVGPLMWYEWQDNRWIGRELEASVDHGHSLDIADINADGNLDIFVAEMRIDGGNPDAKSWVFYGNGQGSFTKTEVSSGYDHHEARVADLDGDRDLDILAKPYNHETPRIDIWLNERGAAPGARTCTIDATAWKRNVIDTARPDRAIFVTSGDLDRDGLRDIASGAWWYRNPGADTGAWERQAFGAPLNNVAALYDFDGDGDLDALGAQGKGSDSNAAFAWARNDGGGRFTVLTNIAAGTGDFLQGVAIERFRQNGPLEIALSWHAKDSSVQMLTVPNDPTNAPWSIRTIADRSQQEALSVGDIDRDGDADLLQGTQWLRNDGSAWAPLPLHTGGSSPDRNRLADLNGDGRLDAVIGYEAVSKPGRLAWYTQPEDATTTWQENVIIDSVIGPMSLDTVDMDGDGDIDVVVGEHNLREPKQARLLLFENTDGRGGAWREHTLSTGDEHHDGAQSADMDSDGDTDIISIGWGHGRVLQYTNQTPCNTTP